MQLSKLLSIIAALLVSVPSFAAKPDDYAAQADKEWRAYITPLLPLGERVAEVFPQAKDPQLRQEMFRLLYSQLGAGFMQLAYANPRYPDFIPNWTQVFNNNGNINPDAVYQFTPLEDDGVYKISGFRGSVRIVDMQIGDSPVFSYGKRNAKGNFGPTLANFDIDDFHIGQDGAFEFILSKQRPQGYKGDWRPMPPKTNYLLVRQLAYDWLNEIDARLAIDRLDLPAAKPRQSAAQIKAALDQIPEWAERWPKMNIGFFPATWGMDDKAEMTHYEKEEGGRAAQIYIGSRFDLAPDEALIWEMAPGKCRFWNLHLGNELLNTLDFMNHQIGLNGFTARTGNDGRIRLVVSAQDPGIPNWLDTVGYKKGYLWGRLDSCENNATPTITRVKVADIRQHLPEDTPVVSAEERDAAIRLRRKGAQLRRRW